jgi:hypothetical protein
MLNKRRRKIVFLMNFRLTMVFSQWYLKKELIRIKKLRGDNMKKLIWIPVIILLVFLFSCQKKDKAAEMTTEVVERPEIVAPIAQEVKNILDGAMESFAEGNISLGAESLLKAVLIVKPKEDQPAGFEEKIKSAKEYFRSGDIGKGVESVSEAYLLIKPPSSSVGEMNKDGTEAALKTDEEITPSPIAAIFLEKLLEAQGEFKNGNADKGVQFILESLLLLGPRSN